MNTGWVADYPAPSTMYDVTACYKGDQPILPGFCDPELDRRAAAAASMLQSEPGRALRAWTEIDQDVTDQAPFVAWRDERPGVDDLGAGGQLPDGRHQRPGRC